MIPNVEKLEKLKMLEESFEEFIKSENFNASRQMKISISKTLKSYKDNKISKFDLN